MSNFMNKNTKQKKKTKKKKTNDEKTMTQTTRKAQDKTQKKIKNHSIPRFREACVVLHV